MTTGPDDEFIDLLGDQPDGVVEIVETAVPAYPSANAGEHWKQSSKS